MQNFVHLHLHSEYSLLDGACRLKELVLRVKELGQTAVAVTDHGNMFAAVEFYNICMEEGVKPIIGCEVYVAPNSRFDKSLPADRKPYHLVLLCENNKGYQNLIKLVSLGYTEGFYSKPRVDEQLLRQYSEGLICLSACLSGEIPRLILKGDYNGAKETALKYREIFGEDNYFLEVQDHNIPEQQEVLIKLKKLSDETGIPLVATNDCHYINKEDASVQKILTLIATGKNIHDTNTLEFPTDEFYIKSLEQMRAALPNFSSALEVTNKIAERCNVTFTFGETQLPYFKMDGVEDNEKFLRDMCLKGLAERYKNPTDEAVKRLDYELDVITSMGYTNYYLIVWDFINYAKTHNIPVGPGRGSGAGSLCAYCIGITDIDPLKYNLLFERFLNPKRVTMPDFDIDFCFEGRPKVIDYVTKKYGEDHVAQIVTFGTLAARNAVRDVARAMDMPYQTGDRIAKLIPYKSTLKQALEQVGELKKLYAQNNDIRNIYDMAINIEGMPRNVSTHAAGVVITRQPLDCYVPLYMSGGQVSTQYTMTVLERLGLLKIDFLGLKNLTIINKCCERVKVKLPEFNIKNIPLDDAEVFDMLSRGDTMGVFQFESAGITSLLMKMKPKNIEDLIVALSLYRPGPMDSIPEYIKRRNDPKLVRYKHPLLKDILESTEGCIIYQEQVMQIFRTLAGYSYSRADIVRRSMAKKKSAQLEKERQAFIYGDEGDCVGAVANGVDSKTANEIFDDMKSFASYAFNKSHAAAYATISYQTAYLKCHYYKEYMASVLTNALGDSTEKLNMYISQLGRHGMYILPVDINKSDKDFTAESDGIRMSLLAIKNLGIGFTEHIVNERNVNGNFKSLYDFCQRLNSHELNNQSVEYLIKSGAMDSMTNNRREMLNSYEMMINQLRQDKRQNLEGQLSLFGDADDGGLAEEIIKPCEEFSKTQLSFLEYQALGMYVSTHPLDSYYSACKASKCVSCEDIIKKSSADYHGKDKLGDAVSVKILGLVREIKNLKTKKGDPMCFVTLEDKCMNIEIIVFPDIYAASKQIIKPNEILFVTGKISLREEEEPKVIASYLGSGEAFLENAFRKNLCVKVNSREKEKLLKIKETAMKFSDENGKRLNVYFEDLRKMTGIKSVPFVKINEKSLNEFMEICGSENVAFMERKS